MVRNKYKMYSLSILFAIACGCATTDKDVTLRSGLANLEVGNYKAADKSARKILNDWPNNHSGQLLRAEAFARSGETKKAIDICVYSENLCRKDLCENETAHINILLLLTSLTNDEAILKKSQEAIESLKRKIAVRQNSNLVDFYKNNARPQDAVAAFDSLVAAVGGIGNLTADQKMVGFSLYYINFMTDKAKEINNLLTPQQKARVKATYGEPQF